MLKVSTDEQMADALTKAVPLSKLQQMIEEFLAEKENKKEE